MSKEEEQEIKGNGEIKMDRSWIDSLDPFVKGSWSDNPDKTYSARRKVPVERPLGVYKSSRKPDVQEEVSSDTANLPTRGAFVKGRRARVIGDSPPITRANGQVVPRNTEK